MDLLFSLICWFLEIYELVILARCIFSFFGYSRVYEILCMLTDPVIMPIRNILFKTPLGNMPLDFSPVVAMLLIGVVERCLVSLSRIF